MEAIKDPAWMNYFGILCGWTPGEWMEGLTQHQPFTYEVLTLSPSHETNVQSNNMWENSSNIPRCWPVWRILMKEKVR